MKKILALLTLMSCSLNAAGYLSNHNPVSDLDRAKAANRSQGNTYAAMDQTSYPARMNTSNGTVNPYNNPSVNPNNPSNPNDYPVNPSMNPNNPSLNPNNPSMNPNNPSMNPNNPSMNPMNQSSARPSARPNNTAELDTQIQMMKDKTVNPHDIAITFKDRAINAKIRDRIASWPQREYENINLSTDNGVVTLSGTVEKQETANDLAEQLKKIDGVKDVRNNIKVSVTQ